jgi:hypothetical protein
LRHARNVEEEILLETDSDKSGSYDSDKDTDADTDTDSDIRNDEDCCSKLESVSYLNT